MKKSAALALCAVMLFAFLLPAAADETENFLYPFFLVDDQELYCLGLPLPENGAISVTANDQNVWSCRLTTAEDANIPITYFIIVDQSSALSNKQKEQQLDALNTFCEKLRPIDKMILGNMSQSLQIGPILNEKGTIQQAILDACVYKSPTNDPYESIVKAVEILRDDTACPGLRCLIMISDGIDDQGMDVTEAMAREAIRDSRISYHTISLVDPFPTGYALGLAARMQSMSEESLGGINVTPLRDNVPASEAAERIMRTMLACSVIEIDAAKLDRSTDTMTIQTAWKSGGEARNGSITLETGALPELPTEPPTTEAPTEIETEPDTEPETETTTEATTEAPTETEEPHWTYFQTEPETQPEESGTVYYAMIGTGIAAILMMIGIVILLSRRQYTNFTPKFEYLEVGDDYKPNQNGFQITSFDLQDPDFDIHIPDTDNMVPFDFDSEIRDAEDEEVSLPDAPLPEEEPEIEIIPVPGCTVRLVPVDHEGTQEFFLPINTPMTMGRSHRADVILSEDDPGLSGVHFELQWDGRMLYLRDMNSTNGTTVNGVPQKAGSWTRVENGTLLRAGSFKYNVYSTKSK